MRRVAGDGTLAGVTLEMGVDSGPEGINASTKAPALLIDSDAETRTLIVDPGTEGVDSGSEGVDPGTEVEETSQERRRQDSDRGPSHTNHRESDSSTPQ